MQKKLLVVLVVFVLLFVCCKKNNSHPTDHTPKMAGVHHWHGTENYRRGSFDSVIRYIDDSFSIVIVNNKEIISTITHNHLYYDNIPWDSILKFSYKSYVSDGQYYEEAIYYYILSNRMIFYYDNPYPKFNYSYVMNLKTP